jgi:beta-glucosidase
VQLYLQDHFASTSPAVKSLKAFEKVTLMPNEKKTINFVVTNEDLQFFGKDGKWISEPGSFSVFLESLSADFELK